MQPLQFVGRTREAALTILDGTSLGGAVQWSDDNGLLQVYTGDRGLLSGGETWLMRVLEDLNHGTLWNLACHVDADGRRVVLTAIGGLFAVTP